MLTRMNDSKKSNMPLIARLSGWHCITLKSGAQLSGTRTHSHPRRRSQRPIDELMRALSEYGRTHL